jgi:hypothetical protein
MKNMSRHIGTLEIVSRLPSSRNGNPRYLLRVDGFTCRTSVDSSFGYSVTNFDGKRVEATIGTHFGVATLNTLRKAE